MIILSNSFSCKRTQFRRSSSSMSKVDLYLLNISIISSLTFCYITKLIEKKNVLLDIYFSLLYVQSNHCMDEAFFDICLFFLRKKFSIFWHKFLSEFNTYSIQLHRKFTPLILVDICLQLHIVKGIYVEHTLFQAKYFI